MIAALDLDREIDLSLFATFLRERGIHHRVSEDGARQILWVSSETNVEFVREVWGRIERGEIQLEGEAPTQSMKVDSLPILSQLRRAPLTTLLLLVNGLFYPATLGLDRNEVSGWLEHMTFVPFEVRGDYIYFGTLSDALASGEYWRLISPMFMQFSVMHIVFNLLWVWEIGRRIESLGGAARLLLVVILSSLAANGMQYWLSGPSLFGGMSGVVFGLLGYALVWSKLIPGRDLGLPNGIYIFMLAFLAIGFTGMLDFLLPGSLANGAHLGGFLGGVAVGLVAVALERLGSKQT